MASQIQGMDTEYKPWGLTAGAMVGERQADTDAANLLALQESQLGNILKQRDAMEAQAQMQNPEWLKWKLAGQMGEGMSKGATGTFDQGVLQDKMASSIADFQAKRGTDELTKVANSLQMIKIASQENGPLNGILSLKGKVPDKLLQFALQNPGEVDKIYEGVMTTLSKTPAHRAKIEEKNVEADNNFILHSMKEEEANARNDADNKARSADRIAQRQIANESKMASEAMRREAELSRRQQGYNTELKVVETEIKDLRKERDELSVLKYNGQKLKESEKASKLKEDRDAYSLAIKEAEERKDYIREKLNLLSGLSSFKAKGATEAKPKETVKEDPLGLRGKQ
jgi:hypothetical protein